MKKINLTWKVAQNVRVSRQWCFSRCEINQN